MFASLFLPTGRRLFFWALVASLASVGNASAQADFQQGPERVGQRQALAGTIIGEQRGFGLDCVVILADRAESTVRGLGGGGRFFLCGAAAQSVVIGQHWQGQGRQTATRRARVGTRWRVLPVYE